jgi:hypothetical protein
MTTRLQWPDHPDDQHELKWWTVDIHAYQGQVVREHRALYHKHTRWRDLYPDSDHDGADYEDQIQLFDNGQPFGRHETPGFQKWLAEEPRLYATREAAVEAARLAVGKRMERLRSEIAQYETVLASLLNEQAGVR